MEGNKGLIISGAGRDRNTKGKKIVLEGGRKRDIFNRLTSLPFCTTIKVQFVRRTAEYTNPPVRSYHFGDVARDMERPSRQRATIPLHQISGILLQIIYSK